MIHIDYTVSLGNILTIVTMVLAGLGAWSRLEKLLTRLEARTEAHATTLLTHERSISQIQGVLFSKQ